MLYQLGQGNLYTLLFHDVTSGNNISKSSSGRFTAVPGFDLCTGWGTPNASLITALVSPGSLAAHNINVTVNPANSGTVTGAAAYLDGTNATLTATSKLGFAFAGWTENGTLVSSSATYTFPVNGDRSLVANFDATAAVYTVVVSATPFGYGTVSGGGAYVAGSKGVAYAIPKGRKGFLNWTENGAVVSTDAYYSFTVDRDRNLVATFGKKAKKKRR